jgi:large subunit ribosomal protein L10
MKKNQKNTVISELIDIFDANDFVYITDASGLSANDTNKLRRELFKNGVQMRVAKNNLINLAMQQSSKEFGELSSVLKGSSAIMVSENLKAPALTIKNFRKKGDKPQLKGAFIDSAVFIGDDQLDTLTNLKSKEDMVAEVLSLLQSPVQRLMSGLQSSGHSITGILKTLSEKEN